jgi:membrane-associated phospholipid phosphatase
VGLLPRAATIRAMSRPPDEDLPHPSAEPPAERLAERLEARAEPPRPILMAALHELGQIDRAVYRAIAVTPSPTLDEPLRRISTLANNSAMWIGVAGALFVAGGRTGRRAAATGLVAVGVNSAIVNLPMKFAGRRSRPDREGAGVPRQRWVPMPTSTSFPSGHSASAFAFTEAVTSVLPGFTIPLRSLATIVAYSRVHTGVHYPGDVVVGSLVGATIGEAVGLIARRVARRRHRRE